jgi:glycosyltransferase involved in cell wall biosynthesis
MPKLEMPLDLVGSARKDPLRVLLVPDYLYWVTGTIARGIAGHVAGVKATIMSAPVLNEWLALRKTGWLPPFDIVHFLTPHGATLFFPVFGTHCACVATVHHIEDEASTEPVAYCDAIMTGSEQWRLVLAELADNAGKVTQAGYGIDTTLFRPGKSARERRHQRRKLGISEDSFVVGFSAKKTSDTNDRKGSDVLQAMVKRSAREQDGIHWLVRGPGWQDLVADLRRQGGRISHEPFLATERELARSYHAMDAFVVTARIEGGPFPLMEAMSCGLPVVTTRVGIAAELVEDEHSGFLIPFDSPEVALARLLDLRDNRELCRALGSAARAKVREQRNWSRAVGGIGAMYGNAVQSFRQRHQADLPDRIGPAAGPAPSARWIAARECAVFSEFLRGQGAGEAARRFAHLAICRSPLDAEIWRRCAPHSPLAEWHALSVSWRRRLRPRARVSSDG